MVKSERNIMKNSLNQSIDKLIELINGCYTDFSESPWGMEEYDHFEKVYLNSFSEDEKVAVFRGAYERFELDRIENKIKQLFYLASVYRVRLSKCYFDILRIELSEEKKRVFFEKAVYYIGDRWSLNAKRNLSLADREILDSLCEEYKVKSPL